MKNFFGTFFFLVGLGALYAIFNSSEKQSWWVWMIAVGLVSWGLEMVITSFVDKAKKDIRKEIENDKLIENITRRDDGFSKKDERVYLGEEHHSKDVGGDKLYEEAVLLVREAGKASTSYLQRKLRIGYASAARLMDTLESHGVIGAPDGSRPRDVIIPTSQKNKMLQDKINN